MSDSAREKRAKKPYSNPYRSLEAIWSVLRRHASRERPLTVKEIHAYLKQMEDAPSLATLTRLLPREKALMDTLYPGQLAEAGQPLAVDAYQQGDTLHIVVETPDGQPLVRDGIALEAAAAPFHAPSYSAIDKQLKDGIPFDLHTFPFRLRCVAQVPSDTKPGKVQLIPYDRWEEQLEDQPSKNNVPRRYYLDNALTEGEWRIFSDLIQVYPFLTDRQAKKFLTALNHLRPRSAQPVPDRYAYRRGNQKLFRIIGILDKAIRSKRMVALTYGEYRLHHVDGRWTPVLVPRARNSRLEVEPYALMWSNGNYYLVAKHRGMMNLRVDRILEALPLETSFEPPPRFDLVDYRDSSPVMYPGMRTFVRMRCSTDIVNTLLDFFGSLPQYAAPREDGTVEVTMSIAPGGLKLFALQYAGRVEVLDPPELRQEILKTLEEAAETYRS